MSLPCGPPAPHESNDLPPAESWLRERMQTAADMKTFLERLIVEMRTSGFSERDRFRLRLALEEAIVNAIKHAHSGDPAKWVVVRYHVNDKMVLAEVEDEGPGFDPARVPDPLAPENLDRPTGRGVFLIRYYMTWVK